LADSPDPRAPPALQTPALARPASPFTQNGTPTSAAGSAIPWRRANVRHTSNELYVDIVEKLSVIYAPSGRPLSAIANGTIAFTAKISGVPDLLLTLTAPGGKTGVVQAMDLPCFHPCVRLARWREQPGELSFVPPDGRFVLAGYECNLLPEMFTSSSTTGKIPNPDLNLPVSVEIRQSLSANGDEFQARLILNPKAASGSSTGSASIPVLGGSRIGPLGNVSSTFNTVNGSAPTGPTVEDVMVTIPIPHAVRTINELRASKGEASYLATEGIIEWRVSNKEIMTLGSTGATLKCTVVGAVEHADDGVVAQSLSLRTDTFDYDDKVPTATQSQPQSDSSASRDVRKVQQNLALMPRSASLSFSVRGWLASGIKVESLLVQAKTSKGLSAAAATPYKGVKYHTISRRGVEIRV
jgi:AP-3 complex subunit mu